MKNIDIWQAIILFFAFSAVGIAISFVLVRIKNIFLL